MHGAREAVATPTGELAVTALASGAFTSAVTALLTRKKTNADADKVHADAAAVIRSAVSELVQMQTAQLERAETAAGAAMSAAAQARIRAEQAERATAECHEREQRLAHRVTLLEARIADLDASHG